MFSKSIRPTATSPRSSSAASSINQLPPTAAFNDLAGAGLPHFSGQATFARSLDLKGAGWVELPQGFGEVARVRVAGQDAGVRAWSPCAWDVAPAQGLVDVEIAVTNTLLPFVEGQLWEVAQGQARPV